LSAKKAKLIILTDSINKEYPDYACGNCHSIVESDEHFCPICNIQINWNKFYRMTYTDLKKKG